MKLFNKKLKYFSRIFFHEAYVFTLLTFFVTIICWFLYVGFLVSSLNFYGSISTATLLWKVSLLYKKRFSPAYAMIDHWLACNCFR